MKRAHLFISGIVQGVFYRYSAREAAQSLGLKGWVRNRSNGQVEAIVEGHDDKIEEFIKWCHNGPPGAHVWSVDVTYKELTNEFTSFSIVGTV